MNKTPYYRLVVYDPNRQPMETICLVSLDAIVQLGEDNLIGQPDWDYKIFVVDRIATPDNWEELFPYPKESLNE